MDTKNKLVEMRRVSVSFKNKKNRILKDVNITINQGEVVGLVGESGAGKSTLAHIIYGNKTPDSGEVFVTEGNIGLVMQNPQTALDPLKNVAWTLRETLKAYLKKENKKIPKKAEMNRILEDKLEEFGIPLKRLYDYPYQFSGGELQRICLLRALLREPKLLILDEATSMLDVLVQAKMIRFLLQLQNQYKLSYLVISHDLDLVKLICDRIYAVENKMVREIKGEKSL